MRSTLLAIALLGALSLIVALLSVLPTILPSSIPSGRMDGATSEADQWCLCANCVAKYAGRPVSAIRAVTRRTVSRHHLGLQKLYQRNVHPPFISQSMDAAAVSYNIYTTMKPMFADGEGW